MLATIITISSNSSAYLHVFLSSLTMEPTGKGGTSCSPSELFLGQIECAQVV